MKFFVYGRLKSDEKKAWMIPFAKSEKCKWFGFRMYRRADGSACMMSAGLNYNEHVCGEVREAKWADIPILGWLLLKFLDMNEGTSYGVYKRVLMGDCWMYLYTGNRIKDWTIINEWHEIGGKDAQNTAV